MCLCDIGFQIIDQTFTLLIKQIWFTSLQQSACLVSLLLFSNLSHDPDHLHELSVFVLDLFHSSLLHLEVGIRLILYLEAHRLAGSRNIIAQLWLVLLSRLQIICLVYLLLIGLLIVRDHVALDFVEILYHHFLHLELISVFPYFDLLITHCFISWFRLTNSLRYYEFQIISLLSSWRLASWKSLEGVRCFFCMDLQLYQLHLIENILNLNFSRLSQNNCPVSLKVLPIRLCWNSNLIIRWTPSRTNDIFILNRVLIPLSLLINEYAGSPDWILLIVGIQCQSIRWIPIAELRPTASDLHCFTDSGLCAINHELHCLHHFVNVFW